MATDTRMHIFQTGCRVFLIVSAFFLSACGTGPLVGLVYTNVRMPLTLDLDETPVPEMAPHSSRVFEVREPVSGAGLYARVSTNAIGELARENGVTTLYFADQQVVSILGIWKTHQVHLYGVTDTAGSPLPTPIK